MFTAEPSADIMLACEDPENCVNGPEPHAFIPDDNQPFHGAWPCFNQSWEQAGLPSVHLECGCLLTGDRIHTITPIRVGVKLACESCCASFRIVQVTF